MTPPSHVTGRRVVAWIVDAVLVWGIAIAIFYLVADHVPTDANTDVPANHLTFTTGGDDYQLTGAASTAFFLGSFVFFVLYTGVLPGITGWTLGKRLAGVQLVGEDGTPPGPARGAVRSVAWIVDGFPYFLPGLVGFIVTLSTQRRQRVGDQIAKTFVVRAGTVPESEARPLAPDAPPSSAAAGWYADPRAEQRLRYWDGHNWTAHTAP